MRSHPRGGGGGKSKGNREEKEKEPEDDEPAAFIAARHDKWIFCTKRPTYLSCVINSHDEWMDG